MDMYEVYDFRWTTAVVSFLAHCCLKFEDRRAAIRIGQSDCKSIGCVYELYVFNDVAVGRSFNVNPQVPRRLNSNTRASFS